MSNLYLLAILPPPQLSEQIDEIRKECSDRFKVFAALKPPVHITLRPPFKLDESREKYLYRVLSPACRHKPFEIDLENFGSFNIQVVYVHVKKDPALVGLYKKINSVFNRYRLAPKDTKNTGSGFNPHVTIAYRDVPAETFPDIWNEFGSRKFKRTFHADRFTLLKHDGKRWNTLHEFVLRDEPKLLTLF